VSKQRAKPSLGGSSALTGRYVCAFVCVCVRACLCE